MNRVLALLLLTLTGCAGAPSETAPRPGSSGMAASGGGSGSAAGAPDAQVDEPFGVILFIGDGTGVSHWSTVKIIAESSDPPMAIQAFPVVGLVDTRSSDSRITDSAAGATAYATGVRTFNGAIGLGPDSVAAQTVLELAEGQGWATGLVATSTVVHATPAAFAAHVTSRAMFAEIATQMAEQEIDVLLGGGRRHFQSSASNGDEPPIARLTRDATYVEDAESFRALDLDTVRTLVGLFDEGQPQPAPVRTPSLPELTEGALQVLERDEDGFFLMVEGSQVDWRGHENAPLSAVIQEVQDLDRAIAEALRFQERRPNTLIVVTADHGTGGLALHGGESGYLEAHYTTDGHTGEMVPLFAKGPGALGFGGIIENDAVGRLLLHLVRNGGAEVSREP